MYHHMWFSEKVERVICSPERANLKEERNERDILTIHSGV